jgi:valyl-tRNA synthetase
MRGKEVFYPIGWDDNGLATERRMQNYYGVTCDPNLPYDPDLRLPAKPTAHSKAITGRIPVSRRNFIELCRELTELDEHAYALSWKRLGLSVDWSTCYRTIDDGPSAASQRAFLRALAAGDAYQATGPVLWDTTFATAVAQAEIEDREVNGSYWRLAFEVDGGPGEVIVATTRPELLPACVALIAHPDDSRYQGLFGMNSRTPLFGVRVPILAHHLADPAKGTGIAMVCTFGDTTDVTWWRDLGLPARPVLGTDGRLLAAPPDAIASDAGRGAYAELAGLTARAARAKIAGLLGHAGALRGDPEPVSHPVKFYEKGDSPLEILGARQWYLRNGSSDPQLRARLIERGRELAWHPPHMRARYENWVNGLTGDWLISRQRYFAVPIPVWYPLGKDGQPDYASPITPADDALPVDPATDTPPGYAPDQRDVPGGFTGERDVMDTWTTSSLTPQIAGGWASDDDLFGRVYPMDLRPQAHEIIRTWLFYTVLRSHVLEGELPWRHAAISGWILDPDRKKMSKSSGNVVTPADLLREYGTDAVRYWAASARLGVDTAFDLAQVKVGRRLAIKILNAARFVLAFAVPAQTEAVVTEPLDRAMLARLADVVSRCTAALDDYDHALALELAEQFFWQFCDDYLELVKRRAYGTAPGSAVTASGSAVTALRLGLSVLLRLLAPVLPFVTEEVWSWWNEGSIHRAPWPDPTELASQRADGGALDAAADAIRAIRRGKSQARLSQKAAVVHMRICGPALELELLSSVLSDVVAAGNVGEVELIVTEGTKIEYGLRF